MFGLLDFDLLEMQLTEIGNQLCCILEMNFIDLVAYYLKISE